MKLLQLEIREVSGQHTFEDAMTKTISKVRRGEKVRKICKNLEKTGPEEQHPSLEGTISTELLGTKIRLVKVRLSQDMSNE